MVIHLNIEKVALKAMLIFWFTILNSEAFHTSIPPRWETNVGKMPRLFLDLIKL